MRTIPSRKKQRSALAIIAHACRRSSSPQPQKVRKSLLADTDAETAARSAIRLGRPEYQKSFELVDFIPISTRMDPCENETSPRWAG
jgi:hypothetical protein